MTEFSLSKLEVPSMMEPLLGNMVREVLMKLDTRNNMY